MSVFIPSSTNINSDTRQSPWAFPKESSTDNETVATFRCGAESDGPLTTQESIKTIAWLSFSLMWQSPSGSYAVPSDLVLRIMARAAR
jgi:hypothetical protein